MTQLLLGLQAGEYLDKPQTLCDTLHLLDQSFLVTLILEPVRQGDRQGQPWLDRQEYEGQQELESKT